MQKNFFYRYKEIIIIIVLGAIILIASCITVYRLEIFHAEEQFTEQSKLIISKINEQINTNLQVLLNLAAFYNSSEFVKRDEFDIFTNSILKAVPNSLLTLEWVPKILHDKRLEHEAETAKFFPKYQITVKNDSGEMVKSPKKAAYFPINFINPYISNENEYAFGFDLASTPKGTIALNKARDMKELIVIDSIGLDYSTTTLHNFFVLYPVYKNKESTECLASRRHALKGYVLGVFNIDQIFSKAFEQGGGYIDIDVINTINIDQKNFFIRLKFLGFNDVLVYTIDDAREIRKKSLFSYSDKLKIADGTWEICCMPNKNFKYMPSHVVIIMISLFMFGSILVSLFCIYFYKKQKQQEDLLAQKEHLDYLVEERTRDLNDMNLKLKKSQENLEESVQSLIQTERVGTLGAVVAGIVHELNNPLSGIKSFVQYAIKHLEKKTKIHKILQDAEVQVDRCIDIVKNILAYSAKGEGLKEKYQTQSCAKVLDKALFLLAYRIKTEHIEIKKNIAEDLGQVYVQTNKIQQVFINLLNNAFDAVKFRKSKKIIVSMRNAGDKEIIVIEDTGVGIPKEKLKKIFRVFYSTKEADEGVGLGLQIVKQIIEEHLGTIKCESKVNVGTKFIIELPIKEV